MKMKSSQMLKGVLDSCVLMVLSRKPYYGYDLIDKLNDYGFSITQGTLYPLLIRLEKKGYVQSYYEESSAGPRRKYYRITDAGRADVDEFFHIMVDMSKAIGNVIEDYQGDKDEEE